MIKISADSTCDLSPKILEEFDIAISPLYILAGDETFRDGVDITPKDVFRYVDVEGKPCKTAAVNVFDYQTLFREFASQYEAVIHICIGSAFSSCFQNASIAAQDFPNVYVVDSMNLSTGSGHIVYEAARMAKEGVAPQEICKRLLALVPKVEASFVIDRLDYLRKGGRCSALTAQSAKLLSIKPCIEVINGEMTVGKKYHGSFEKCLLKYVRDRLEGRNDIDPGRMFITHPMCSPEAVEAVRNAIGQYAAFEEIIETRAGCTVSSHCGPNTLGILFMRK
jgi:DegV family protein with EDD domain